MLEAHTDVTVVVCLGAAQPAFFPSVSPLRALFSTEIFMPRGHEYLWTPRLLVLEGTSNLLIAGAFLAAALSLARRPSGRSRRAALAVALALAFAAALHVLDVWVIWAPLYWLDALVRCLAALVAVGAALVVIFDRGDR